MSSYTLSSERIDGHLEVAFENGNLTLVKMLLKRPLNEAQFRALMAALPQHEAELHRLEDLGLKATIDMPNNEKLGLFCRLYEQSKGIKYRVSPADAGKIKLIKIDEALLRFYFNSANFLFRDKHTVSNLVRYYNELLVEYSAAYKPKKIEYPDHFSKEYHDRLTAKQLPGYWAHLRSLGFVTKKDTAGNVIDWIIPPKA